MEGCTEKERVRGCGKSFALLVSQVEYAIGISRRTQRAEKRGNRADSEQQENDADLNTMSMCIINPFSSPHTDCDKKCDEEGEKELMFGPGGADDERSEENSGCECSP